LIGAEVGQRAGDLLSITPSNVKKDKLRLTQKKTSKNVVVPLASETLELMELFPDKRAVCSLSRNFKTLCLMAGIDSIVLVRRIVDGVETLVEVPKHEAVASHVLRRTFASNLYYSGMPPTLIMSVTKHSTEKQLIDYIGATDEEVADTFQKAREKLKRDEKS
jgi:integrase